MAHGDVRDSQLRPHERTRALERKLVMASSSPPTRANLEYYRKQAKALVRDHRAGAPAAVLRVQLALGARGDGPVRLSDAQHVVAREHGAGTWAAFARDVRAASGATAAALEAARRGWGDHGEATLDTGALYAPRRPVRVRVRKRGRRYDLDDAGGAVEAAGRPPDRLAIAERVAAAHDLNVNREGVVFVPAFEGRDLARLADRVAETSLALYDALLDEA
jgi:hypothetical protein